ncbi:MAG: DUF4276 family protein [Gammaproteobacteria bacterium]
MKLYVEGGGVSHVLKTACRHGFSEFLKKAGVSGKMPKIIACGSRQNAYKSFCTAIKNGDAAMLLVDSESPIAEMHQQEQPQDWQPWQHLRQRQGDEWQKPANAGENDCHLMVQCMEAWFLADNKTLQAFFGQGFNPNALPATASQIETITKERIYQALADATKNCKTKAKYGKGEHSFKLLARIDPTKVIETSLWAKRFVDRLNEY